MRVGLITVDVIICVLWTRLVKLDVNVTMIDMCWDQIENPAYVRQQANSPHIFVASLSYTETDDCYPHHLLFEFLLKLYVEIKLGGTCIFICKQSANNMQF